MLRSKATRIIAGAIACGMVFVCGAKLANTCIESEKLYDEINEISAYNKGWEMNELHHKLLMAGYMYVNHLDENGNYKPKIKVSENIVKVTNPGNKTIFRLYDKETGKIRADLIALTNETYNPDETLMIFDPISTWKKTWLKGGTYTIRELLVPVFIQGKCVYESPSVMEIRDYCIRELDTLWDESRRLVNPQEVYVDLSKPLWELKNELLDQVHNFNDK